MKIAKVNSHFFRDIKRAALLIWEADRKTAFLNMVLQLLQAILPVVSLFFMKEIVEAVVQAKDFGTLLRWLLASGGVLLLGAIIRPYAGYIHSVLQQKLQDHLAKKVITKAMETDYSYYEDPAYHDAMHHAQQHSLSRAAQLSDHLNAFLFTGASLVVLVVFFATLHSLMAVFLMLLALPLAFIKWVSGLALFRLEKKAVPAQREADYLFNTLTGIHAAKEVRTMDFGRSLVKKFSLIRSIILRDQRQLQSRYAWYSVIAEVLEVVVVTGIFLFLARQTWEKVMTVGIFVVYLQGFQRMQGVSKGFLQVMVQLFQQRLFLKELFTFLDIPSSDPEGMQAFPVLQRGIRVKDLCFSYTKASRPALSHVSMDFPPGRLIAIVGENGSGKSTLVKLLSRLYKRQSGTITAEGIDFSDITLASFRMETSFLFQDFEKYFFTVRENISLGSSKKVSGGQAIEQAARLSGAHDFIMRMGEGYHTRLGRLFEGSEQLSGGQWQRLVLARSFYRDAQLTVLDEPTSALDPDSEGEVLRNIRKELRQRCVVLVTHRLNNLNLADYIYVMKEGRVAEEGSFETLVSREGLFSRMYAARQVEEAASGPEGYR
ncbi:MAG: ABC transporter ATP-binding protein [Flavisolibacter sp.]